MTHLVRIESERRRAAGLFYTEDDQLIRDRRWAPLAVRRATEVTAASATWCCACPVLAPRGHQPDHPDAGESGTEGGSLVMTTTCGCPVLPMTARQVISALLDQLGTGVEVSGIYHYQKPDSDLLRGLVEALLASASQFSDSAPMPRSWNASSRAGAAEPRPDCSRIRNTAIKQAPGAVAVPRHRRTHYAQQQQQQEITMVKATDARPRSRRCSPDRIRHLRPRRRTPPALTQEQLLAAGHRGRQSDCGDDIYQIRALLSAWIADSRGEAVLRPAVPVFLAGFHPSRRCGPCSTSGTSMAS